MAYRVTLRSAAINVVQASRMSMMTRQTLGKYSLMGSVQTRFFATGGFPDHVKLEMPNLSPTMEKVSYH